MRRFFRPAAVASVCSPLSLIAAPSVTPARRAGPSPSNADSAVVTQTNDAAHESAAPAIDLRALTVTAPLSLRARRRSARP